MKIILLLSRKHRESDIQLIKGVVPGQEGGKGEERLETSVNQSPAVKCFKNQNGEVSEKQKTQRWENDRVITAAKPKERGLFT